MLRKESVFVQVFVSTFAIVAATYAIRKIDAEIQKAKVTS